MAETHPRIKRERKTLKAMAYLFCSRRHGGGQGLCTACKELLAYASRRLDKCPYGKDKPACSNCPIHCYKPDMRERIRDIMRFAGPRMVWRHPVLAVCHLIDARRKASLVPTPKAGREISLDK